MEYSSIIRGFGHKLKTKNKEIFFANFFHFVHFENFIQKFID